MDDEPEAKQVPVTAHVSIPEGDLVLAILSVRLQPDRDYAIQLHPAQGTTMNPHELANLLRWMADRLDIEGL